VINRLVLANLKHRRLRTMLSALSIGFQVTMILAVVGLSRGMLQDSQTRARGAGADIFVKPPAASAISLGGANMPEKMIPAFFSQQPHVACAAGSLIQPIGGISTVTGVEFDDFVAMSGIRFIEGGRFTAKYDVVIDEYYAEQNQKRVGDKVRFLNNDWRVTGIIEAGKLARIIAPLATVQELTSNTGKISQVLIKLDDPRNTKSVIATLKTTPGLEGYSIYSVEEFVSMFSIDNVPGLKAFIYVIIGLSIVIGFLVVCLTMYTTVLERTREIGILKALGASPFDIVNILLRETLVLALAGWASGVGLSYAANAAINGLVHASLQSVIVYDWWPRVLAIAVFASLLGAVWPGLRAARQDAIEALAYE
jgi:putative ABC transport system permease protein